MHKIKRRQAGEEERKKDLSGDGRDAPWPDHHEAVSPLALLSRLIDPGLLSRGGGETRNDLVGLQFSPSVQDLCHTSKEAFLAGPEWSSLVQPRVWLRARASMGT